MTSVSPDRATRREVLKLLGVGGLALPLAACGVSTQSNEPKVKAGKFNIVHSGAKLPSSDVQLRWMDSGDNKADFFNAFFPAYTKAHPNIKVDYTGTNWTAIQQVITLGLHNGTAPDVFQLPPTVTPAQAVHSQWVVPIDDLLPGFASWKNRFPPGTFANGITDFGGKTYGMPLVSNVRINYLTLYNSEYMKRAGYDPSHKPLTWTEFRDALKKITKQGAGQYYGIVDGYSQTGRLSGLVTLLAQMAGANEVGGSSIAAVNPFTGHYNFASDEYIAAMELMLAIKSDGSFFPGTASITNPIARQRFPLGVAGVLTDGPWDIVQWQTQNRGFSFGVGLPPVAKSLSDTTPRSIGPGGAGKWFIPTTSKLGPVAADIYYNMMSESGQTQWNDYDGGADPSVFPASTERAKLSKLAEKSYKLAQQWTVLGPEAAVRKPQIGDVYEAQVTPSPSWSDTAVGLFTGQVTGSVRSVMQGLQDRYEASLDAAIKVVNQREGTNITRDDFLFKDWNPHKPYTKLYPKNG